MHKFIFIPTFPVDTISHIAQHMPDNLRHVPQTANAEKLMSVTLNYSKDAERFFIIPQVVANLPEEETANAHMPFIFFLIVPAFKARL